MGVSGHRGNRGEPAWAILEHGANKGVSVTLSPDQCRSIILWASEVTEDKNAIVRQSFGKASASEQKDR